MPAVEYSVTTVNGVPVISAPVEVDVSNADGLRQRLLVRAHKRAAAAGGEVRLVITAPTVLRLFEIVGIDGFFPIFKSLDEAVASPSTSVARPIPVPGTASSAVAPEPTGC